MPNQFDRVIKEELRAAIPFISKNLLGLDIRKSEILKDKIQITEEREADYLLKILHDDAAKDYILHLEFQSDLNEDPLKRMFLYYAMAFYKHTLPVEQFVIYIGKKPMPPLKPELNHKNASLRYHLIDIRQFGADLFLNAQKPEAIMFAILSDFGDVPPQEMLQNIIKRLKDTTNSAMRLKKFIRQLQVLSTLRNLQPLLNEIIDTMPITIDYTEDVFYKTGKLEGELEGKAKGKLEGKLEGEAKSKFESAKRAILFTTLSDEDIALINDVDLLYIKNLRKELKNKK